MDGMVEKRGIGFLFTHMVLLAGVLVICFPVYIAFVAASHTHADILTTPMPLVPGPLFFENMSRALFNGAQVPVWLMLLNSLIMALGITIGKIVISLTSAYAIVYFRFPFRMFFFWMIFMTLMLPVEVRIVPTFEVVAGLGMLNSYSGLIFPLIASATATFLFRQVFLTIPDEMVEAARIDGAGPVRFFFDILIPMSRTNIAALFVILFIYGWNQYLWPMLITTRPEFNTVIMGLNHMIPRSDDYGDWPLVMSTAILAMLPPLAVVILMQRLFVKGLVESEK